MAIRVETVGILSLGAMGSAFADALVRGGVRVVATTDGRSARTIALAARTGVELLPDGSAVIGEADVVLSIVPPEAAVAVATDIAEAAVATSATPLVVDLNAIAPTTSLQISSLVTAAGCEYVDGSISGPPPWKAGTTRIYLAGARAADVAELLFTGVDRIVVGNKLGTASAVKMSTASVYKGSSALVLQALRAAHANGVLHHVLDDLRIGSPELVARIERRLALAASKSGRYVGEMHEIAATQAAAGLTPSLFEGIADVYAALSETPLAQRDPEDVPIEPSLESLLDGLRV